MAASNFAHPHLHALIGDAAFDVPAEVARDIELALREQRIPAEKSPFFSCLDHIRCGDGADGQPWATPTPGIRDPASLSRSLGGLMVILDLLHAAERTRVAGAQDEQIGDFYTDGLIIAARQMARTAYHCMEGTGA